MKELFILLSIGSVFIVVGFFMLWRSKQPLKLFVGTILDAQVKWSLSFGTVTLFTIKNANEKIIYAYSDGRHRNSEGKQMEYQLSKLGWLVCREYCYEEEIFDKDGNKLIYARTRRFNAISKGRIIGGTQDEQ